jgi:DNA-binding transcriptional LysR family regulator
MDRFHAITAFVRVVEAGSFARAADRMGVSVSAVSRQIAELEAHLDVRLLNRTTRRLSLTESGQAFFDRCVQLLADLEEAEVAVTSASTVPRGTLRLTSSATFGSRHLAPAIAAFATRHPQMRFDVELSERIVDIVEEGFDLAVRIGATGSQNLVARRIGATRILCCAAVPVRYTGNVRTATIKRTSRAARVKSSFRRTPARSSRPSPTTAPTVGI